MTEDERTPDTTQLGLSSILTFSAVILPVSALGLAMGIYLPRYFAGHLGVSLAAVGTALAIVRLIDIPVDPILGLLMDRTRTRIGRYRPWLMLGGPILMLATFQLFMAPAGIGRVYLIGWLLVLYLGTSITGLSHTAWASTLAPAYNQRSRLFGVLAMVGVLGALVVLGIPLLVKLFGHGGADGVQTMGWLVIGLIPLAIGLVAWRIPEHVGIDHHAQHFSLGDYGQLIRKPALIRLFLAQVCLTMSPGWMSAIYLFFFKDVLGFSVATSSILLGVYVLAGVAGAPATAWVSTRFGKHRTLMFTTSAYSLGLCSIVVMPRNNLLAIVPVMLWCGSMASGFNLLIQSMTADVGDEVRLEQGKQRMSLIYSLTGLAGKIAGAAAIFLPFFLLARVGYKAVDGAHNTAQAIMALKYAYIMGPIVFAMLGGACFIGWRLDAKRHGEIRRALDSRDAQFAEAPIVESLTGQPAIPVLTPEPD